MQITTGQKRDSRAPPNICTIQVSWTRTEKSTAEHTASSTEQASGENAASKLSVALERRMRRCECECVASDMQCEECWRGSLRGTRRHEGATAAAHSRTRDWERCACATVALQLVNLRGVLFESYGGFLWAAATRSGKAVQKEIKKATPMARRADHWLLRQQSELLDG